MSIERALEVLRPDATYGSLRILIAEIHEQMGGGQWPRIGQMGALRRFADAHDTAIKELTKPCETCNGIIYTEADGMVFCPDNNCIDGRVPL